MALASAFVAANLLVDSASFRQRMLADLLVLLVRSRDSLVLQLRWANQEDFLRCHVRILFLVAQMWVRFWFLAQILRHPDILSLNCSYSDEKGVFSLICWFPYAIAVLALDIMIGCNKCECEVPF